MWVRANVVTVARRGWCVVLHGAKQPTVAELVVCVARRAIVQPRQHAGRWSGQGAAQRQGGHQN